MAAPFHKDLRDTSWDTVFARQIERAALVPEWLAALGVGTGDRVLDVGCGPGYVSLRLAERVGPTGVVYAVDRSDAALAYLARRQREERAAQIRRIAADAATLPSLPGCVDAALVTMVLHHADDPAGLLRNVARLLPPEAGLALAEFHPDGPGGTGPPCAQRLSPDRVRSWCRDAGLPPLTYRRQTPEHYLLFARRHAGRADDQG